MNQELTTKLFNKYPELFARHTDPKSDMSHGIFCDDGWYQLIETTCRTIQKYINTAHLFQSGRINMPESVAQIEFDSVKEKFGKLRFSVWECPDPSILNMMQLIETLSGHVCEVTGNVGETYLIDGRQVKTLCKEEAEKRGAVLMEHSPFHDDYGLEALRLIAANPADYKKD